MGDSDEGTRPVADGVTTPDSAIPTDAGPAYASDLGPESSPHPTDLGDAGALPGSIASDLPDTLLGAVIPSDYQLALDQVLDHLATSINLFDVPSLGVDYFGHFDGGSQG